MRNRLRFRLWVKLALFGVAAVVVTHALDMAIGLGIASGAIAREQMELGEDFARLVAHQATNAVLTDDQVELQDIVARATEGRHVAYCFIERNGELLASSFADRTPEALVGLRGRQGLSDGAPIIVRDASLRIVDVAAPMLGGSAGWVRLGLDMRTMAETRRRMAVRLGLQALGVIAVGVLVALLVGRRMARPVGELLAAADRLDPRDDVRHVSVRGSDELGELSERFNSMVDRLKVAHEEHQASIRKSAESQRLAALGSLMAGVAHEVNNPLAGLKNCVSALKKNELPPQSEAEYLELMSTSVDRIEEIVCRLLDFGRPQPLRLKPETPERLAREAASLVLPLVKARQVALEVSVEEGAHKLVLADRHQITQALLNLLLNALYVTPTGGRVRLSVWRRDGRCGVGVVDEGPGIPVPLRGRVLDPFFSTKPEGEGTGLGLTVTRAIVDAHGGELTFEFPERGTVATVWLKISPGESLGGQP